MRQHRRRAEQWWMSIPQWGDIEKVRNLLVELKVRVFAEVVTPSRRPALL